MTVPSVSNHTAASTRRSRRPRHLIAFAAVTALLVAACGDDDDSESSESVESTPADTDAPADTSGPADTDAPVATDAPADTTAATEPPTDTTAPAGDGTTAAERYTTPLSGVCPDTVVFQTNWWPQPDHALAYQLIGPDGEVDTSTNSYSGPLGSTGVDLEIRAGGPALGFQPVASLLYQDDDILLGLIGTDEQVSFSGEQATTGVLAWYRVSPQVFIWGNPEWDFQSVADIGASGATVLAFEGSAYLDVFTGQGLLDPAQIDTSYQGGPARFVADDGNVVQQGFLTSEPYSLEFEVAEWGKPVEFLLVSDEYPVYQNTVAVRADRVESDAECLGLLVPLLQQAAIDYVTDPEPINAALVDFVSQIEGGGFELSAGKAADAVVKQLDNGIVANGPDGVFGSFDQDRLQVVIDQLVPVFQEKGTSPAEDLTPADLATDEFLDPSISL
jgi:hypothetical protein